MASPANFQSSIVIPSSPHSEVQSEIDAMSAQFSPYVGMGGLVGGRSGQTGFDHLIAQSSDLEASTTLGNEVRLTAIVKPVFAGLGRPHGQHNAPTGYFSPGYFVRRTIRFRCGRRVPSGYAEFRRAHGYIPARISRQ